MTEEDVLPMEPNIVTRAVAAVGTTARLARMVGVTGPAVLKWRRSGRVPAERVLAVEAASGVPRHELRPDLYPTPVEVLR